MLFASACKLNIRLVIAALETSDLTSLNETDGFPIAAKAMIS